MSEKDMAWLMYKKGWSEGWKIGYRGDIGVADEEEFEDEYNKARVERVVKEMEVK